MRITDDVAEAAAALRDGRLVAIPTETVYGLGALATDPRAVARVYAVKGRPADHPLIVHVGSSAELASWGRDLPDFAIALAEALWPGPMTLVVRRSDLAGNHVTGGQDTVAVRVPAHPIALQVLSLVGSGVAAPSANRFGRVSPTTPQHVVDELDDVAAADDVVLDGGPCGIGLESTIIDCTGDVPRILRPGAVTPEDVRRVTGLDPVVGVVESSPRAPGTLESHYAPVARVVLVDSVGDGEPGAGLLALADVMTPQGMVRLSAPVDVDDYARALYAALREADALQLSTVYVVAPAGDGLAAAIRDRLARAAHR